jgi:hypothetical protein
LKSKFIGQVTTIAGCGSDGEQDGVATEAKLKTFDLFLDKKTRTLYFTQSGANLSVRTISLGEK